MELLLAKKLEATDSVRHGRLEVTSTLEGSAVLQLFRSVTVVCRECRRDKQEQLFRKCEGWLQNTLRGSVGPYHRNPNLSKRIDYFLGICDVQAAVDANESPIIQLAIDKTATESI